MQIKASLDLTPEHSLIYATGAGFKNMTDIYVMDYKQAMASTDASKCQAEVDKENNKLVMHGVWDIIPKASLSPRSKILKST